VLFVALLLGLLAGFAQGGRLENLAAVRLRLPLLIFGAVALRLGTEAGLGRGIAEVEALRLPLLTAAYAVLAIALWANRSLPGLALALVGIGLNAAAIILNHGYMPVWQPSLLAAGFGPTADALSPLHVLLPDRLDAAFLAAAGPLGDIVPVPLPYLRNVLSIGDIVLTFGLGLFLFSSMLRPPVIADGTRTPRRARATELPVAYTGAGAGVGHPVRPRTRRGEPAALSRIARVRTHPYARIATNGSFMSLWTGQLISLLGDRIHQIALAFLVLAATGSAVAVSLTFVAATIPNLVFGPLAGVFVDRWNQKRVLIASDLLRAGIVLLVPPAVVVNVILVYPLVFLLTTVSIFFRPARSAVVPRIVAEDELMTANSATWLGETLADVVGYPLAGLFVGFLAAALPLAFYFDAATYMASAALIFITRIPDVTRHRDQEPGVGLEGFRRDLVAGLQFLRREPVLWANTLQAVVGQFTIGATIALTPLYAERILAPGGIGAATAYAFMETALGVGNLLGGFVIGLLGTRLAKGRMVILGYVLYGIAVAVLGLTGNVAVALGLAFGMGVANMAFVIPTQTLFLERTPESMMGRVLSVRFSAVFGSMTLAMAVSGLLGETFGIGTVFVAFGAVTTVAGLAGLASSALRRA
jgi:MFS family permease